ncbi:MAG TPA: DUF4153 domain-containing protein [Bacteroidales bacterium]|nr:DUF4153 domain-containing protein [Bacteroidales bacterium]
MNTETKINWADEIKANLGNPEILEGLYRNDRKAFKTAFDGLFQEIENTDAAKFWKPRLDYEIKPDILKTFTLKELLIVAATGLLAAFLIKIPAIFSISDEDSFYFKNAAIIVFFGLALYTMLINRISEPGKIITSVVAFLIPVLYSNLLPSRDPGDAVILVYIHLPMLMWFIYGIVWSGFDLRDHDKRIDFIRHNGDLAITYALIAAGGGVLTLITVGLFNSIGFDISEFYAENIVFAGAVAAPVVAAYLIGKFPALVSKIAPLIAGIFSPLVLITLIVFLVTMILTGKDPYNDRDFLLIFNVLLLGVMVIIIFSVSGTSVIKNQKFNSITLFILSVVTIIIDLVALSAIFYRLGEYGLTPNRLAILVSNILVLINLIMIMAGLYRINFRNKEFRIVEMTVSRYLPVYLAWIIFVVFAFPLIFGMK